MISVDRSMILAGLLLAGLGGMPAPASAAGVAQTRPAAPRAEALPPLAPLLARADAANGEAVARRQCATCHSFTEGGKAGLGPNLFDVVGGPQARMADFAYSDELRAKAGQWTPEALNQWLARPDTYAPGTKMGFAGIANAQQRADLIAYLSGLSHNPVPLPSR